MVRTAPIRAIRAICVRTPHKKRANTRFAPTRHNIIQLLMVNCQLSCRVHGTYCVHSRDLRNLRSDNPTPHKKRANTRFAPTLTTLITVDYSSLFTFHSSLFVFHSSLFTLRFSLYKNFGYPFSYAHDVHAGGQRKNMIAGGGVHRANE